MRVCIGLSRHRFKVCYLKHQAKQTFLIILLYFVLLSLIYVPSSVSQNTINETVRLGMIYSMRESRKFCQGARVRSFRRFFFFFFLLFFCTRHHILQRGEDVRTNILNGPPSACQRNAISMAFRWPAHGGVIFQGRGSRPLSLPWIRAYLD